MSGGQPEPPPAYAAARTADNSSAFERLPDGLILRILTMISAFELMVAVRPTCTKLRSASTHLIRSTLLPQYDALIRPPFTSDPLGGLQEVRVLDLFALATIRVSQLSLESPLHLISEDILTKATLRDAEWVTDIFELYQPKARLEDLLSLTCPGWPGAGVKWALRWVGITLPFLSNSGKGVVPKVILELPRDPEQSLEALAGEVASMFREVRFKRRQSEAQLWYER